MTHDHSARPTRTAQPRRTDPPATGRRWVSFDDWARTAGQTADALPETGEPAHLSTNLYGSAKTGRRPGA